MDKAKILAEIQRTAAANGGVPLGLERFYQETGIRSADWKGKIWARWGDAVREAGLEPNTLVAATDEAELLERYAAFVRELGRLPVISEMRLRKRTDPALPNEKVLTNRYGSRAGVVRRLMEFCGERPEYADVASICRAVDLDEQPEAAQPAGSLVTDEADGFVYLMKSGRYYKVGKTNSVGRRASELAIQLPERLAVVHTIRTDDPGGIESYWHRRFESKRLNGEWFDLDAADIRAFKRRKFM